MRHWVSHVLPHDLSNVDSGEHLAQDPKLKELRSTDQHTYICVLIASHCVCCPLAQNLDLPSIGDQDNADSTLERTIQAQRQDDDRDRLQVLNLIPVVRPNMECRIVSPGCKLG